jgi:hypothetical protein
MLNLLLKTNCAKHKTSIFTKATTKTFLTILYCFMVVSLVTMVDLHSNNPIKCVEPKNNKSRASNEKLKVNKFL